jgi:glycosyltransferase involved in cell wall biosynthesis
MKSIIIFSGHYNVKVNGSTKEVDENLVKYIDLKKHQVVWIGVGVNKEIDTNLTNRIIDINDEYKILKLFVKFLNMMKRINLLSNSSVQYLLFVLYDYFLLKCVYKNKINIKDSILIARNASATRFISKLKGKGLKTIIHAQWLHPKFQKKNVEKAYSNLGISFNQKSFKLLKRQTLDFILADKIWTFSKFGANTFIRKGVPKEKIMIHKLGADKNKFNYLKNRLNEIVELKSFKILFVGNISPEKGVDFFLEYLMKSKLEGLKVTFLGNVEKNFNNYFFKNINKLLDKGIHCEVKSGDSSHEYLNADLLILPSIHDSFGLVVPEALMSGLPVLVSSNSGASELIKNNYQGQIFSSNNMEDFSCKLENLIKNKFFFRENKKSLSQKSQVFDWESVYNDFSKKILNELF